MPQQVVCPSVSPSVTMRYDDHISWNTGTSKIISRLIILEHSLSLGTNIMHESTPDETPRNFSKNRSGVWKNGFRRTNTSIFTTWLYRVAQKKPSAIADHHLGLMLFCW